MFHEKIDEKRDRTFSFLDRAVNEVLQTSEILRRIVKRRRTLKAGRPNTESAIHRDVARIDPGRGAARLRRPGSRACLLAEPVFPTGTSPERYL